MQPDLAWATQRCEEQAFAAEQRALDAADRFNAVIDARLKRDDAASVDADQFARSQIALKERSACVNECEGVSSQYCKESLQYWELTPF